MEIKMKKTHSVKSKQFFLKVLVCMVCFVLVNSMAWTDIKVSATGTTSGNTSGNTTGDTSDDTPDGNDAPAPTSSTDYVMVGGNWVTPTAVYGKSVNVVLPIVNMGEVDLKDVIVTPVISGSSKEWPFEIETSGYSQTVPDLPGVKNNQSDMDRKRELTWTFDSSSPRICEGALSTRRSIFLPCAFILLFNSSKYSLKRVEVIHAFLLDL